MSNGHEKAPIEDLDDDEVGDAEEDVEEEPLRRAAQLGEVDLNRLAEKVYERLRREVLIERERRSGRISG
jgi:hypothetical protein